MSTVGFDAAWFRRVLGHLPTGVAVVTATDAVDGRPVGMAVGSVTSVSLDPPLVAFLPARSSTTFPLIRDAGNFCLNILADDQHDLCATFARSGGEKFERVGWRSAPSGAPILDGIVAWIDCRISAVHEAGDHYIVVGEVGALDVAETPSPLVFFQGRYRQLRQDGNVSD